MILTPHNQLDVLIVGSNQGCDDQVLKLNQIIQTNIQSVE